MNYRECLEYLEQVQILGIKFGLDNVRAVLSSLGDPHVCSPTVLVGGTNGKGSVCAMLDRILTLNGYRAGLYTSPHLIRIEERIRIGGQVISKKNFCQCLSELKDKIQELLNIGKLSSHPTYFETVTCLALLYFQKKNVDLSVLEVGMGGRFDATNVVTPLFSVITTISPEHQEFLGSTVEEIAREKAGIIKEERPIISSVEAAAAKRIIKKRASELNSPVVEVFSPDRRFSAKMESGKYVFQYSTAEGSYKYSPSLAGHHQGKNAATAVTAAEEISKLGHPLDKKTIIKGIETTHWEGRLETLSRRPLIVLDGAHNEEGALALKKYIGEFLPSPITLVYAAKRDKKVSRIAPILFGGMERIILTRFPFRKAAHPEELLEDMPETWRDRISLESDPRKAFDLSVQISRKRDHKGCVLIAGSLFLVGEAKKYFSEKR